MKELIEKAIKLNEELGAKLKDLEEPNLKLWDYLPKEGEYFHVKLQSTGECIAIAKEGETITDSYVNLYLDSKDFYWSGPVCKDNFIVELRPATPQEIALLDTKLKENGKYFDKATMSIKDIVNEPELKRGDWVLITKPKDVGQKPYWSSHMDKYDGQTLEIK